MRALAAGCLLLLSACAPPAGAGSAESSAAAVETIRADSTVITLERTPCFGACPVYAVEIGGAGTVRFTGRRHTAHVGDTTARISVAQVDSLLAELRDGGYFDFADAYVYGEPACGRYATDSPSAVTSVVLDGRRKEIRHDYGCSDSPLALRALERRIDEVAGTARWTGR